MQAPTRGPIWSAIRTKADPLRATRHALRRLVQRKLVFQWFNPSAFAAPSIGTLGNAPRNFLQDQNFWNLDTSVHRLFPIKESLALKIDVEAFNVLNHPVLGSPGTTVTTASSFAQITTTAFGNSQRILQFAAKVQF